nr:hypothetical protein [Tanacetum cinerariifolium]
MQVQAQALNDAPLPVIGADHGIDLQAFNKDGIQTLHSAARQGRPAPLESGVPARNSTHVLVAGVTRLPARLGVLRHRPEPP